MPQIIRVFFCTTPYFNVFFFVSIVGEHLMSGDWHESGMVPEMSGRNQLELRVSSFRLSNSISTIKDSS